ncbi:xylulokinase [Thioclava sp. A2]|uniref:xylulokinase n=1 Tax=Thioclava sp. FCG-A2 TaxID=3080562 RepID=UPI0029534A84|nr:xylulokinase [Thioclava sp. A2]MDV7270041.1 xylulokinase [Thioclava sp. A2]
MFLGLDLGTSGLKALLINDAQQIVAQHTAALTVSRPHEGWSEQAPADWIVACETAIEAIRAEAPAALAALKGIGLSGQMHGATLLDGADQPLRPCLLWNDTRAQAQAERLDADPQFREISGNIVFAGFTAPKVMWVAETEPSTFEKTRKILLPKDYLRLWLTGEHVSEMSDAAGTSWLDTGARDWSDALLEASGMRRDQMPALVEGSEVSGLLRPELAARWGIKGAVPVAGGAGDNAASAIGAGTIRPGRGFISLGTSGVLFAANAAYRPNPASAVHSFCHALPDTWHQMGVILSAASALGWYADLVGTAPADLTRALGDDLLPPGEALFLPYLAGERTPYNSASLRARFDGLSARADRESLTRAVLEGVAYALKDNQAALAAAGTAPEPLLAMGGGSRSSYWLRVIATVLDVPVLLPAEGDFGAAFGAARLGILAATGATPDEVCTPPAIAATIEPERDLSAAFAEGYARFTAAPR